MAKQKDKASPAQVAGDEPEEKEALVVPVNAVIDVAVTVISLAGDPYHKDGEEFQMAKKTAEIMAKRGTVKIKEEE